jgi:hypothetical protein
MIEKDEMALIDYSQNTLVSIEMLDGVIQRVNVDELPEFVSLNQGRIKTFSRERKHRKVS